MFSLQKSAPGTRMEGVTDENPILLPLPNPSTAHDFDNLLIYLYKGPSEHPKTDEFLISVLQLSTFFQLEDGVAYSITEFERKGEGFDPALQFQLARMFRVDQWIEPAFRALMKRSDTSLTLRNLSQIGETGCYYLMQTKDKIRKHRAHLAFSTPKISQSQDCKTRWECKFHWEREWWEGFARLIHHPEITLPFGDIPKTLLDVRDGGMDGVCDGCLHLTIDAILEEGKFQQEAEEIVKAVAELMKYQTDEPIRAAFRNISTASSS
ncbi:hypothetical protein B0H14DRAFT_2601275 [Mycena olivaceomarginata]|nr:hypothetical protein B0H14DRAFT_2601275 [Mycena olivaceomarginata]